MPSRWSEWAKMWALAFCVIEVLILGYIAYQYQYGYKGIQYHERLLWIQFPLSSLGTLHVYYTLGTDGLSLALIFMSTMVFGAGVWISDDISKNKKSFYALYLLMMGSVYGCFLSMDLIIFYIFFEFMLLPMYFLIGIWGGERREYASIKFFLYTLFGSVLILIGLLALYSSYVDPEAMHAMAGKDLNDLLSQTISENTRSIVHSLQLDKLYDTRNIMVGSPLDPLNDQKLGWWSYREWTFLLLFVGFSIKLPSFPFHTWLPDAHVEAPTSVSMVLAGILLKVGGYGLFRIVFPLFISEAQHFSTFISWISVLSILWAAYCALATQDLKKMVAYSSISHMGYVSLGLISLTPEGVTGAAYQLIAHGYISATLFLTVGILYKRTHDRTIANYRGLANSMPLYTGAVVITYFAALGLPGFAGFIAEILVYLGAFKSLHVSGALVLCSTIGLVITAGYYLWTLQRMHFGVFWIKETSTTTDMADLSLKEKVVSIFLLFFIILLGVYPSALIDVLNPFVEHFLSF